MCIRKPQTHKKEGSSSESLENYCSLRFKTFALHCTQQCEYNSRLTFTDVTGAYLELKTCLDTGPELQVCLQSRILYFFRETEESKQFTVVHK